MNFNLELKKFINFLNISAKNKNILVKYKKNTLITHLLKIFFKRKLIHCYYYKNNIYYIYLKYNTYKMPLIKITSFI